MASLRYKFGDVLVLDIDFRNESRVFLSYSKPNFTRIDNYHVIG